jgi:PKD repeat protein
MSLANLIAIRVPCLLRAVMISFFIGHACLFLDVAVAEEAICARVRIEIRQEMTFERQAFDAHMQINNGLTTIPLEDIQVDVLFSDEEGQPVRASSDPNDAEALFFIRISSMSGTDDVAGAGVLPPASKADIHWLIIPAPASVEDTAGGALYYVGARLQYTINGEQEVTEVTPDYIHVRPLPLLTLDYFLPDEVYGDDPFTEEIEPSIPFSLGVRIANNGHGPANKVKIDSAQPKIVENEQGLAVDFKIIGSEVNGITAPDTLLIDFGDIPASSAATGRWLMTSTLSGRFVEFDADFSHSNELGGELTSLVEEVNTHFLVRDVLADAPGRDHLKDFLGKDNDFYRVYESDAGISEVIELSGNASISLESENQDTATYIIQAPIASGFFYLRLDDPQQGGKVLEEVVRSDGKTIKPENGWLSKIRVNSDWSHFVNIFDHNGPGQYTARYIDPSLVPTPPIIEEEEDPVAKEGEELILIIETRDPNSVQSGLAYRYGTGADAGCGPASSTGSDVTITAGRLPVGATFIDCGNGKAILRWTPIDGQAGEYPFAFTAINDEGSSTVRYHIAITDKDNTPTAHFTADSLSGTAPYAVTFTDKSTSIDGIKSRLWDFGDGQTSTLANPRHMYSRKGLYSVALTVAEIDGDTHTSARSNYIRIDDPAPPEPPGPPEPPQPARPSVSSFLILLLRDHPQAEADASTSAEKTILLEHSNDISGE